MSSLGCIWERTTTHQWDCAILLGAAAGVGSRLSCPPQSVPAAPGDEGCSSYTCGAKREGALVLAAHVLAQAENVTSGMPPLSHERRLSSRGTAFLSGLGFAMQTQVSRMSRSNWKLSTRLHRWILVPSRCTSERDTLASHPVNLYHHNQRKTRSSLFFFPPPLTCLLNLEADLKVQGTRPSAMLIYNRASKLQVYALV